jgi:hypothetical protein
MKDKCDVQPWSSRVCECGTKCCIKVHSTEEIEMSTLSYEERITLLEDKVNQIQTEQMLALHEMEILREDIREAIKRLEALEFHNEQYGHNHRVFGDMR